jgi:hypothetical protein
MSHRCTQCHKYFNPSKTTDDDNHRWCVDQLLKARLTDSYDKWVIECRKYSNSSRKPKIVKVKKSALGISMKQGT